MDTCSFLQGFSRIEKGIYTKGSKKLGWNCGYDESGNEKAIFCGILSELSVSSGLDGTCYGSAYFIPEAN